MIDDDGLRFQLQILYGQNNGRAWDSIAFQAAFFDIII